MTLRTSTLRIGAAALTVMSLATAAHAASCGPQFQQLQKVAQASKGAFQQRGAPGVDDFADVAGAIGQIDKYRLQAELRRTGATDDYAQIRRFMAEAGTLHLMASSRGPRAAHRYAQTRGLQGEAAEIAQILRQHCGLAARLRDLVGWSEASSAPSPSSLGAGQRLSQSARSYGNLAGLVLALSGLVVALILFRSLYKISIATLLRRRRCLLKASIQSDGADVGGEIQTISKAGCNFTLGATGDREAALALTKGTRLHLHVAGFIIPATITHGPDLPDLAWGLRFQEMLGSRRLALILATSTVGTRLGIKKRPPKGRLA